MALAIVGALLMSLAAGVPALAGASPVVTFSFQPPSPDGNNDWWRNPPLLSVTSDQDGTVHYDWGSGDTTVAADAGSPVSLGYSPEGVSTLRAFCVSSLGETGTVPQVTISVDSELPPFPDVPTLSLTGGRVHLAWDPVTDAGSGLAG